jgi:DNA repair protein RecO (recombination protein O)
MNMNTDGLVIKENTTGENDRVITLLTRDYGIIRAFVRGAKSIKSRSVSATQLLGYSKLSLYKGKDAYIVDDAQPREIFFGLRGDIERLALAQYLCELAAELAPREAEAAEYLSLMLNSLHLLTESKRPQPFLKAVAELRMMCLSGYMPDLVACSGCGAFGGDYMYFNIEDGSLICSGCAGREKGRPLGMGVITAMRHICYSEPKKIFSFTLSDESQKVLADICEAYLLMHIQKKFKTLDFYKQLRS